MPTYKLEYMEKIHLLSVEATSVEEGQRKLKDYLEEIGVEPGRFFFIEIYTNGELNGALVHVEVPENTERTSGIRHAKLPASDYLVIDASEEEYEKSSKGHDNAVLNIQGYMKEHKLKMKDFPVTERVKEDNLSFVRVYIAVKQR